MMQIIVVSDTHSRNEILDELVRRYPKAYAYIHCGDLEDDPRLYPHWRIVRGNNDYWGKFQNELRIRAGSHTIYVTHSHRCSYLYRDKNLARLAQEFDCDIVLYGHTHVAKTWENDGILFVNPGSTWMPRDGKSPSYAVLTIDDDKVDVQIIRREEWDF